jgi:hypothetical protein
MFFDANCQTSEKLVRKYNEKQTNAQEVATDPVRIMESKHFNTLMVQTDPMIVENEDPRDPAPLPVAADFGLIEVVQSAPGAEVIPVIEQPVTEDHRDWAESALFEFVKKQTLKELVAKGMVESLCSPVLSARSAVTDHTDLMSIENLK